MKDSEARRTDMFVRVRSFGTAHAASFPANSRGGELFTTLNSVIGELEGHTATQSSGARAAKAGTALKALARAAMREDMEAISRTARAMSLTMPGIGDKFRLPRNVGDQAWLAAARSFARDAEPIKAEFIRRGLPQDFLEDFKANIGAFEDAIDNRAQKAGERVAATTAIDDAIDRGLNAVRELDAVVRNVFRDDPAALSEWTSASHTQRTQRPAAPTAPAPTPPAPPQPPPQPTT